MSELRSELQNLERDNAVKNTSINTYKVNIDSMNLKRKKLETDISEEQKAKRALKIENQDMNAKIVLVEEDLYQSKRNQLDLLE